MSGGGNQLMQPYLRRLFGNEYKNYPNANHVHHFGWYIGNYPDLSAAKIPPSLQNTERPMIIVKSPLRISFFGGSTDYESFYKKHGSFIIGTTINKYIWLSARYRPKILSREHSIGYSKLETVSSIDDIQNPLIREVLRHHNIHDHIDFNSSVTFLRGQG